MTLVQDPIIRRSIRLLNAVLELHKQGFQNLAIETGLSASGCYWRLTLHPYQAVAINSENMIEVISDQRYENAEHTSGETGNEYFGWQGAEKYTAREIAEHIKLHFPLLIEQCLGENLEYAGWLCKTVGRAESGELPIMYADHGPDNADFGPLRQLLHIGGKKSVFADPPHLERGEDWHIAYINRINTWSTSSVQTLPKLPRKAHDIDEHGAYWEGAVWYIQEVLGCKRIDEFLSDLARARAGDSRWATFLGVWNSENQLSGLIAFLMRQVLTGRTYYRVEQTLIDEYSEFLKCYEIIFPPPARSPPHTPIMAAETHFILG